MQTSRIDFILHSAHELREPVRIHGLSTSSKAWFLLHALQEGRRPTCVICPNDDTARELTSDLESLLGCMADKSLGAKIVFFPTWEQSPYSTIAPSLRVRQMRLGAIATITSETESEPLLLITSLVAACQATLPPKEFEAHSLRLAVGSSVDSRERLLSLFVQSGYAQIDPVEDPGSFAVRGEIIDLFPPGRAKPLRIELWSDEIEKIREFDPESQRTDPESARPIREVTVPPAREVLMNAKTASHVREQVKARADDLGISRKTRDPLIESIQQGVYPDHADAWAPFAYSTPASLMDYLGPRWQIIWDDELSCNQEWHSFVQAQSEIEKEAPSNHLVLPPLPLLFLGGKDWEATVKNRTAFFLDRLEAPTDQPRFRVTVDPHSLGDLEDRFRLWKKQGFRVIALASTQSQLDRIKYLLSQRNLQSNVDLRLGSVSAGFQWPTEGLVLLAEDEILGSKHVRKQRGTGDSSRKSAAKDWAGLQSLSDLAQGDAVVHVDHGIGLYQGLVRLNLSGAPSDFLLLEYANKDKLYLPVYRLNVVQKHMGGKEGLALDRLGSQQFTKTKARVRDAVKKMAIDLVRLYAERKLRAGVEFSPRDADFSEFEAAFPFDETPDQLKAIDAVLEDLHSGRVMDRLICGDVGYGKTEVAIRAAFRAVSDGKQVAVLVPTTILAYQHEQSFRSRLKDYPLAIESLSRFKSPKEQRAVLATLASGKVDIIIGTHRLLSRDVHFKDLGLIIVDEEHRFGVEHKERLKTLKINTHVLTLTATPIPRTLHMALSGLRDISLINTPPVDRLPIRTFVSKYDEPLIQRAVEFELNRGGQVFFVHNRVQSIYEVANKIQELCPQALIAIGHGQMAEGELEETMVRFYNKQANVLVCTSIIESGLDLPTANTIIINRADMLGLAQLYQIRGRVGRGQQRAYAYLLIPAEGAITEDAKRRMEVIQRFVELGGGFSVASHDLEIRGGGDMLGPQQSGNIAAVGFDLYTELLEEAIRDIEGTPQAPEQSSREPEIKAPFPAFLAETFVPDVHQRLSMYRRLSAAANDEALLALEEELKDRFGSLPEEAHNLLWLIRLKQLLKSTGMDGLTVGSEKISLVPGPASRLDPSRAVAWAASAPREFQITPDSKLVVKVPTASLKDLYFSLEGVLSKLRTNA